MFTYTWTRDKDGEPCNFVAHRVDARGIFEHAYERPVLFDLPAEMLTEGETDA
jgi:hypothetical protein